MVSLFDIYRGAFNILATYWWLWVGPACFALFERTWLSYKQALYKHSIEWTMLELKIPRTVGRSPKAMDQFFSALYSVRNEATDFLEKYRDGEVTLWFSLEIISFGGEIHFYIRTPTRHKGVVTANLYANYPTLEVEEVEDYALAFPASLSDLRADGFDMFGSELKLGKADAYPIRTYLQFEDALDETRNLDPIASVLEVLSQIKKRENVCVQILVRPAASSWREKGDKVVKELKEKGGKTVVNTLGESREEKPPLRTPGETDVIKAIEQNLSKSGYETVIRYVYLAPLQEFDEGFAKRGVVASFNQYAAQNLNFFLNNQAVATQAKWNEFPFLFPLRRKEARKRRMYRKYLLRRMPEETTAARLLSSERYHFAVKENVFVLNTEELATLFHPPTEAVLTAPILRRVESKRMGPPAGLPIFKPEESLD